MEACPWRVRITSPVLASQIFAPALAAEMTRHPSGLNDADISHRSLAVTITSPVFASQTFAGWSRPPVVTIRDPSGLNDADESPPGFCLSARSSAPVVES